jgi:hypothetical protein
MRSFLSTVAAIAIGITIGAVGSVGATGIPGPVDPSQIIAQVNQYVANLITRYSTTTELQFSGGQSWAVNSNVATTMTSLGPQGASTTVSQWLTVVDNRGRIGFIPWYLYTP